MALIPLKQTVTVYPPGDNDPWNPLPPANPFTLRCRFQEGTEVVTDQHGRDVVSSAQIYFDRYAPVKSDYEYEYTDESGETVRYRTVNTGRKRWLNGKAVLTVVYVR
ncbi:hypothetical protein [Paenibacillus sp. NPDC057967]|uniref:hypothetical protein n=1 Tax=Paenibacillus sp. NPDC057967 TaxID=3346293 RepID=UPI0036D7AFE0